jgi:cation diffusion facilitator CzcD-associated flavoprotein CzcO
MALFLHRQGHSYTVLERDAARVGSFWKTFPVYEELISVNKLVRNTTQHYKYDWHSFLGTEGLNEDGSPLLMANVTRDYFPTGAAWQAYMQRVAQASHLRIEFGIEVAHIDDNNRPCVTLVDGVERCAGRRVFVGTGLREKDEAILRAMGGVPYSQVTRDMAVQRNVCIFGNGNAGFETARAMYGVANRVTILGKQPYRLSAVTRYTGDIRVKFLQVVENFHGTLIDDAVAAAVGAVGRISFLYIHLTQIFFHPPSRARAYVRRQTAGYCRSIL